MENLKSNLFMVSINENNRVYIIIFPSDNFKNLFCMIAQMVRENFWSGKEG